jgi:hypothetical protein
MGHVLAIVSRGVFENEMPHARVGDLYQTELYRSQHAALDQLGEGTLWLVTVRPGDVLWLVAALRRPSKRADGWYAPNELPIRDITPLRSQIRFQAGTGISSQQGKLAMALQTPRALSAADIALLELSAGTAGQDVSPHVLVGGDDGHARVLRASDMSKLPPGLLRWLGSTNAVRPPGIPTHLAPVVRAFFNLPPPGEQAAFVEAHADVLLELNGDEGDAATRTLADWVRRMVDMLGASPRGLDAELSNPLETARHALVVPIDLDRLGRVAAELLWLCAAVDSSVAIVRGEELLRRRPPAPSALSEPVDAEAPSLHTETASAWLDRWMANYPWSRDAARNAGAASDLVQAASAYPPQERMSLLQAAVARLPSLRADQADPSHRQKGTALYTLVCHLYQEDLPRTERDVCILLEASKHDCGHGEDLKPPFEIALQWARANGVTAEWLAAIGAFAAGLKGVASTQASHLKSRATLVLLLDSRRKGKRSAWSERFREQLAALPPNEHAAWERLVVSMGIQMGTRVPRELRRQAELGVATLGAPKIVDRVGEWLPDPDVVRNCTLDTAGGYVLKNLIWLLMLLSSSGPTIAVRCDRLVERLISVEFTPTQLAKKIALVCAAYFAERPPEVAARPLERLLAWSEGLETSEGDSTGIQRIIEGYKR